MIIVVEKGKEDAILKELKELGFAVDVSRGDRESVIGIKGDTSVYDEEQFMNFPGVIKVERISTPYKRVSKQFSPYMKVQVNGRYVGEGEKPFIIAGPCAIEDREHAMKTFEEIQDLTDAFRGMLYKPRTSPY